MGRMGWRIFFQVHWASISTIRSSAEMERKIKDRISTGAWGTLRGRGVGIHETDDIFPPCKPCVGNAGPWHRVEGSFQGTWVDDGSA